MQRLAFIYPKGFHQAHIVAATIFCITIFTLIYIVIMTEDKLFPTLLALVLIGGLGFYLCYLIQKKQLSFTLCQTHIQHHSNKGGWSLPWNKIHSIAIPTVSQENWHQPLPWVALRLKSYEPMLESVSFRVANQILIEQRALLLTGFRYSEQQSHELEDILFDDKPYIAESGIIYRGLLAMLANRMAYTRELLGFDVFIDESLLDRSPEDFVGFTRHYLANAMRS